MIASILLIHTPACFPPLSAFVTPPPASKSAQVRQGPERGKRCCSCTGPAACRDPRCGIEQIAVL